MYALYIYVYEYFGRYYIIRKSDNSEAFRQKKLAYMDFIYMNILSDII